MKSRKLIAITCTWVFCTSMLTVACTSEKRIPIDKTQANVFSSENWKRNEGFYRDNCLFDLRNKHILEGCSKARILEILGQPDNEQLDTIWGYDVRSETASLKILLLVFEKGKVTMTEIHVNP